MRRLGSILVLAGLLAAACEEGPEQIYKANPTDMDFRRFNGWNQPGALIEGNQPFTSVASLQKSGTVKICEADVLAERWDKMVEEPIIPSKGAGGLNLKGEPEWSGVTVDQAQQQLCQAYVAGSTLVYWGDQAELIAFFDAKTRLIDRLVTLTGYEGKITAGPFEIGNNQAIFKDGKPLASPDSDTNIRAMNVEFLKKFRPEVKNPESRDCVAQGTCYVMDWYTVKRFVFNDLMLDFAIEPKGGKIDHIGINLKRAFEFAKGTVKFESTPPTTVGLPPMPVIDHTASCRPALGLTWDHIKQNCLGVDPEAKALVRPVWSNEAIYAEMGGVQVYLTRPGLAHDAILADAEKPKPADTIVGLAFDSTYEGKLSISRTDLFQSFFQNVQAQVQNIVPTVDLTAPFSLLKPLGDGSMLNLGALRIEDCATMPCTETTLTIRTRELVEEAIKAENLQVPVELKDPNFYVEILLREILAVFNGGKAPTASELYIYVTDDTAQTMVGRLSRKIQEERYAVSVGYNNKSDQLLLLFFRRGVIRTEGVLYTDAELEQENKTLGDGVFRLWNLARSPRIGLATMLFPKKVLPAIQKALITVKLQSDTDLLVAYHQEDSLSGYSIPVDGQHDHFIPAAYFGFSGNVIGASLWADGHDGIVKAISSGAFYDKLDFCGVKVGLWDRAKDFFPKLPPSCDSILSYSENTKILTAASTYVQTEPYKIGLRLYFTADRVDGAVYWAE